MKIVLIKKWSPANINQVSKVTVFYDLLLSARTAMWCVPVVLTETENEKMRNDAAKMTL